jgi:predicted enzyme involved in methoxymalonyl-ACP biosynthesis
MAGEYIPTAKNAPAADFFEKHGFVKSESGLWRLDLSAVSFTWPSYIKEDQRQCRDAYAMTQTSV